MKVEKGNRIVSFAKVVDEDSAKKPSEKPKASKKDPNVGADGSEQLTLV
jgi:hypothetical protein